jgi:hypothetical protein
MEKGTPREIEGNWRRKKQKIEKYYPLTNPQHEIPKKSRTIYCLKPSSDDEDLTETGSEFQTRISRANIDPAMYSVDCLGKFILNVLSERENINETYR